MYPRAGIIDGPCICGGGCESPLECRFWVWLGRTHDEHSGAARQVRIGKYRADVLCETGGRRIVIELDGKRWHQDFERDHRRDRAILLDQIDEIIRIPYAAFNFYPFATFACLASWHDRFTLRHNHIMCVSADHLRQELEAAADKRKFLRDSINYDVWGPSFDGCADVGDGQLFLDYSLAQYRLPVFITRKVKDWYGNKPHIR